MITLALIGLIGGLVTGISPCILPVLPVIFFTGARATRPAAARKEAASGAIATAERPAGTSPSRARPYLVIAGLVVSFTLVTLFGSPPARRGGSAPTRSCSPSPSRSAPRSRC